MKVGILSLKNIHTYVFQKAVIAFSVVAVAFAFFFFSFPPAVYAVTAQSNALSARLIPAHPGEQETVTVLLSSFAFDINTTDISVFLDGQLLQKSIGLKTFEFTTKNFGQTSTLKIIAQKNNGETVIHDVSVIPSSVDLIYQLDDPYVPSGYAGKATVMSNSDVTIYAFPNLINEKGQRVAKDSLVYTWYKNYDIEPANSGFGKSEYTIDRLDAFPRETVISVKVSTLDGSLSAESKIVFAPERSEVEFYLLDPLLPFSFKNIANPDISSNYLDTEILAIPYFMDGINDGSAQYTWTINGAAYTHPEDKDKNKILLINSTESESFVEKVTFSLAITNRDRILQSLEESFSVFFSEKQDTRDDVFFNTGKVESDSGFFGF